MSLHLQAVPPDVIQELGSNCHGLRPQSWRGTRGSLKFSRQLILSLQEEQIYLIIRHAVVDQEPVQNSDGDTDYDDEVVQESEPDPVSDKQ